MKSLPSALMGVIALSLQISAQSAPANPSVPPADTRPIAYYEPVRMIPPVENKSVPLAIEVSGCFQYKAPEISLIRCKLALLPGRSLKSYAGHIEFKDKTGKIHSHAFNVQNAAAMKSGDPIAQQFDLPVLEYEAETFQWFLEGFTEVGGRKYGKEPKPQAPSGTIDNVCKGLGYKKK